MAPRPLRGTASPTPRTGPDLEAKPAFLAVPDAESWANGAASALVATGVSPWLARVTLVREGVAPECFSDLRGVPPLAIRPFKDVEDAIGTCAGIAQTDPRGANAALNAFLTLEDAPVPGNLNLDGQDWVTSLPEGLTVGQDLRLAHTSIRVLPRNLTVGQFLQLADSRVETLGPNLTVGTCLDIKHCRTWDGRIPKDASVAVYCFTRVFPRGVKLAYWHRRHPSGSETTPTGCEANP